jgi:hypothetical protein
VGGISSNSRKHIQRISSVILIGYLRGIQNNLSENWGKLELDYPPDYCNDLNAMAEAEDLLSNEQLQTYFSVLRPVVESTAKPGRGYVFTAKASQRAKAFVITIEKWKK